MRYEGDIYRPPSEAYSLLIQVTIGCSHNKCTFCSMFKDKRFRVREISEVLEDLETARKTYRRVEKIFLCDGDALCLSNDKLLVILNRIRELFPECKRVSVYGSAKDVLRKTEEELKTLRENGIGMIYLGAESGSQKVLDAICKGVTREQMIEAVHKIEDAGIKSSVTFISGLAGKAECGRARCGDRKDDQRNERIVCGSAYADAGSPGADLRADSKRRVSAAFRRGSRSRNLSVAEARQSDKVLCFSQQSRFKLCVSAGRSSSG